MGVQVSFLIDTVILGFLTILKNCQASSKFEAVNEDKEKVILKKLSDAKIKQRLQVSHHHTRGQKVMELNFQRSEQK